MKIRKFKTLTELDKWSNETRAFTQVPFASIEVDYEGQDFKIFSALEGSTGWESLGEFGNAAYGNCLFDLWRRKGTEQFIVLTHGNGYDKSVRNEECGLPHDTNNDCTGDMVILPVFCASIEDLTEFVCQLQLADFTGCDEFDIRPYLQKRRNEVYDERWEGFEPKPGSDHTMRRVESE